MIGLLAAAGCTSPEDDGIATANGAGASASPTPDFAGAMRQYDQCLRDKGVEGGMAAATAGPGPTSEVSTIRAAVEACAKYRPDAGNLENESPEQLAQRRAVAKCMRQNGYPEWPDPASDGSIKLPNTPEYSAPEVWTHFNDCARSASAK
ncbi:hypothetical protein OG799_29705 [Micromonospora sp. NBC_00898]|uniref:hypothetical protein n=1 Tax=Micromonospora sp. NBC_00898 TaxID=2975981 RepID=UPI00386AD11E|nr:hypothetical protein OG799_29705 [Micromonospora sp. NBC_00898]